MVTSSSNPHPPNLSETLLTAIYNGKYDTEVTKKVAKRLGVHNSALWAWLHNKGQPSVANAKKLSEWYNIPMDQLRVEVAVPRPGPIVTYKKNRKRRNISEHKDVLFDQVGDKYRFTCDIMIDNVQDVFELMKIVAKYTK